MPVITQINESDTICVNKLARRSRQLKSFSRKALVRNTLSHGMLAIYNKVSALEKIPFVGNVFKFLFRAPRLLALSLPASPNKRLFVQSIAIASCFLLITSFSPTGSFVSTAKGYSNEYMSYALDGDILVADEEGYLVKINPQTDDANRIGMTDFAVHTVESGESLSVIAAKYDISMDTIKWQNNLSNVNSLRAGQKLMIPPVDGISYEVKSSDDLDSIADKYDISTESIIAQNGLDVDDISKGQSLFLPNAEPVVEAPIIVSNNSYSTASRDIRTYDYSNIAANTSTPTTGKIFIFPTRGIVTQGYFPGHYAIDIADRSRPPIWAPYQGTVEKVSTGTYGGGYGNYVIINHGNGLKSLYAHFDSVAVTQGQWVNQGDVLGIMGNTGRTYGATGIHLHWEVIQDGSKMNPVAYY